MGICSARKHARQAGRAIAKAINYYRANERKILISVVLIVALLACRGVYDSINQKREQELAAHQAELARLKDEEIAASHLAMGEVRMPNISMSEDARDVMKKLRDAGFINIVDQPKQDLVLGKNHAQYDIIEITVDGAPSFKTGDWYPSIPRLLCPIIPIFSSNDERGALHDGHLSELR